MKPLLFSNRAAVKASPDLERILDLPRRPPIDPASPRARALVELMTERLRRPDRPPGAPCGCLELGRKRCITELLVEQAWALYEAPLAGGLLAPIGVGGGKTILNLLMPMVIPDCRTAVLFVPPGLVEQLRAEYLAVREHFRVPSIVLPGASGYYVTGAPALHVIPYSRFSRKEATDLLEKLRPDLAICDEVHALKNPEATRTKRFIRFFSEHPDTRLCAWSGSITSKSIKDFAHLIAFALGGGSPLPLDPDQWDAWSAAVDPSDWPAPAGALEVFRRGSGNLWEGLREHIRHTCGVVSTTSAGSCPASIYLRPRRPSMPATLRDMIDQVKGSWTRPDGEEFVETLEVANCVNQLASGFYYRWRFPGNPSPELVEEWFAARKAWRRAVRERLKHPEPHLDSPELLKHAAERYWTDDYDGDLPVWAAEEWPRWRAVKDRLPHETEVIWVDDYLVRDAAEWARGHRGIVWYEFDAFGRAVAKLAGVPLHAGGPQAQARIAAETGKTSIVASWKSHGTGRDGLQRLYCEQLVANPPADGGAWEQLLGRLHRLGQEADEVYCDIYRHVPEFRDPVDRALVLAKYIEGLTGNRQKLLSATVEWDLKPSLEKILESGREQCSPVTCASSRMTSILLPTPASVFTAAGR